MLHVEQPGGLEPLRGEWLELLASCPQSTPFQHPDWLIAWWEAFHPGRLAVLCLRDGRRLAGIAPFYIHDGVLRFVGAGNTDYLDVLVDPRFAAQGIAPLLSGALEFDWEHCYLDDLPGWSKLAAHALAQRANVCPVAPLPPEISGKMRKHLRQSRRRLESRGAEFETETLRGHGEHLEALFRLHRARWKSCGQEGALSGSALHWFHERVSAAFAREGMLRFHALRFEGEIAAVWYWFTGGGRAYCYLSGFSPDAARYSPGSLLTQYAMEHAAGQGDRECDFLRGAEPYKYAWGARDQPTYRLSLTRAEFAGAAFLHGLEARRLVTKPGLFKSLA